MVNSMNTKYNIIISNKLVSDYLSYLINKVFLLLPMFEKLDYSEPTMENLNIYLKTLIQTICGHANLIKYDSYLIVDILSHLESLLTITEHDDYRRCVLKICHLLTELKSEVEHNVL